MMPAVAPPFRNAWRWPAGSAGPSGEEPPGRQLLETGRERRESGRPSRPHASDHRRTALTGSASGGVARDHLAESGE